MSKRTQWTAMIGIAGLALFGGRVAALQHDHARDDHAKPHEAQADQDEAMRAMMEAWAKTAQPGEHHAQLEPLIGSWNVTVKWRMEEDAPWQVSQSTADRAWIMGGRFILEKVKGEMEEGPFEGMGILGYDNIRKKFTSIWIDNMGTSTNFAYGTSDASGKTITFIAQGVNPMSGQPQEEKTVLKVINNDKLVFEMYQPGTDGKKFQSMEIIYTRK